MDEVILGKIEEHWLEWVSLPFAFLISVLAYLGVFFNVDDWTNRVWSTGEYVLLAVPFALLFLGYLAWCIIHQYNEKKKAAAQQEEELSDEEKATLQKKNKGRTIWIVSVACLVTVGMVICLVFALAADRTMKDGKYVVWSEKYHVSLSPEVTHSYYLVGDPVQAKGEELTDYTGRSVLELDFEKDGTFTVSYNGKLLGAVEGENGVGYHEPGTEKIKTLWELEEVEPGVYFIRNVQENTYLKWFEAKNNWTTHPNIVEENRGQYLIRLEPVK